jgi:hypothetical protein
VHLHTIGPRIDVTLAPGGLSGPFIAAVPGLALTEGDLEARAGAGAALLGGYRWRPWNWFTVTGLAGFHAHRYDDGSASVPYVAIELRFHGATP